MHFTLQSCILFLTLSYPVDWYQRTKSKEWQWKEKTRDPWAEPLIWEISSYQWIHLLRAIALYHNVDLKRKKLSISFMIIERSLFVKPWVPFTKGCFVSCLVETGPVVLEKKMKMWKCEKIRYGRRTIRKAYLSYQPRWGDNQINYVFINTCIFYLVLWTTKLGLDLSVSVFLSYFVIYWSNYFVYANFHIKCNW